MKTFLRLALVALCVWIGAALVPTPAEANCTGTAVHGGAHTCYWIGGTNWGTITAWSATPGGLSCACTPATSSPYDDIVLDGFTAGTSTVAAAITINSLDTNLSGDGEGAFAGTLSITATGTVITTAGNYFYLNASLTLSEGSNRTIAFTSTTGTSVSPTTIWTNPSHNTLENVTFNGSGGFFELEDGINSTSTLSYVLTLTAGTVDATTNNSNVTIGSVAGAGSINCGSGTWTLDTNGSTIWNVSGTISCSSASLIVTPGATPTSGRTFTTAGSIFGAITITGNASPISTANNSVSFVGGGATFASMTLTGANLIEFPNNATTTVTGAITGTGTSGAQLGMIANSTGVATLSIGSNSSCTWCNFIGFKITGTGTLTTTNSSDNGGNSGFTINPPVVGGGGHIIGG
jgi:hypothetical protein